MRLLLTITLLATTMGLYAEKSKQVKLPFGSANAPASRGHGDRTDIQFINQRNHEVHLYWFDHQKQRHRYGQLKSGEQKRQGTYAGHIWLITDTFGYPLGHFAATDKPGLAVITSE